LGTLSSDASDELLQLRTELAVARDLAEKAQANALNAEAEATRVRAINADLLARNAHLELMNEKMRREKCGASSERSRRLIDQLELTFEGLEADAAEAESLGAIAAAKATTVTAFTSGPPAATSSQACRANRSSSRRLSRAPAVGWPTSAIFRPISPRRSKK